MNEKALFGIAAALMILVFGIAAYLHDSGGAQQAPRQFVADTAALSRVHSPSLGPENAQVHIVEFLDPACETCRSFFPFVKKLMEAAPGRIRLSVRYAPFHEGSDTVVKMLEAAKLQGKFWEALEAMFATQEQWAIDHRAHPELVLPHLERLGLNLEQLKADMASPLVEGVIRQDLLDASALNVTATPEFFVNGRPMPSFGYEQLQGLVDDELARSN